MKRILISQNESNDGSNYIVVDGELLSKNPENLKYFEMISNTKNYKEIFKDEFITISEKNSTILFSSHYLDLDNKGRQIFYMYLLDKTDNLEKILELLISDSKKINRNIDYKMTLQIVKKIEKSSIIKRKLKTYISIAVLTLIVSIAVIYFSYKSSNSNQNTIKNEQTSP